MIEETLTEIKICRGELDFSEISSYLQMQESKLEMEDRKNHLQKKHRFSFSEFFKYMVCLHP